MSTTSLHAPRRVDKVIDDLNAKWDLRLPHLERTITYLAEGEPTLHSTLNSCIDEFEEEAKAIFSGWIWKPSQEGGTIPSRPLLESQLKNDIITGRFRPITDDMRLSLMEKLSSILDDEYQLARDSEDYRRTSSQASQCTRSSNASFTTAASRSIRTDPKPIDKISLNSSPTKRRRISHETMHTEQAKVEPLTKIPKSATTPIDHFFKKSKKTDPVNLDIKTSYGPETDTSKNLSSDAVFKDDAQQAFSSFQTTVSPETRVFSPTNDKSFSSSNRTSIMSGTEESQDYFPTQDANDCLADESFVSNLDDADMLPMADSLSLGSIDILTPFPRSQPLANDLSFWMRWEIYRIAQTTDLSPSFIEKSIRRQHNIVGIRYSTFWSIARTICVDANKALPPKSDIRDWMDGTNSYISPNGYTAYFTFNLVYNQNPAPSLWKLELNPIKIDLGNRIHRKYGADRHITGFLNYFHQRDLPMWVTRNKAFDANKAFERIVTWIATETHHIAGRQWRAFYLESDGNRSQVTPRQKLSLFAINGEDFGHGSQHTSLSIYQLIDWHIPLMPNAGSTNLKLFSRFGLGLSKTKATVVLQPHQFRYLSNKKPVMNDGCSLMSVGMARAVWQHCGDGSKDVPSAFQARCGGSKGVWISDYRSSEAQNDSDIWIEISESQLKIEPHPCRRVNADETQRTFEVLKWSKPCKPGHLNKQFINILCDRGVSRSTLKRIVLDDIEEYIQASRGAMKDARQLQAWLQEYHMTDRYSKPVSFVNGLPESKEEEVCFLVQCGFTAENCKYLRDGIILLMMKRLNAYVEKLRIEVPYSTSVFCVPDPYQVLEADEVHLGFSTLWENPGTGLKENALDNIDVLVARTPAHLASDIQKRKAVYKHQLRHFKDIIVFPTKGGVPLASLLSGGDYDGDTVTVIWDPQLVEGFHNVEKPQLPSEEKCGLEKVSMELTNFQNTPTSDRDTDKFIESCISFNAQSSRLGICTTEHEKLIYSNIGLSDPGAVLLATLAGYLVDANKQGLAQSEAAWRCIRRLALRDRKIYELAYKTGEDHPRCGKDGNCVNIIDHLKFDVAMKRKDDIRIEFESMLVGAQNYDSQLTSPYKHASLRATNKADPESQAIGAIMNDLKLKLEKVLETWRLQASRREQTRKRENGSDRASFKTDVRQIGGMIREIKPLEMDCNIYRTYAETFKNIEEIKQAQIEADLDKGSQWSLLRASTMYHMFPRQNITWWTVGDELGRIKARSLGPTRELIPRMHHILKADSKLIKRLALDTVTSDGDEDAAE